MTGVALSSWGFGPKPSVFREGRNRPRPDGGGIGRLDDRRTRPEAKDCRDSRGRSAATARACQSSRVTAIEVQRAYAGVFSGRAKMENSDIMIMDRGIVDAGVMDDGPLPGLRSRLFNRRSFLHGFAVSFGALGLAGCASSDGLLRAEAAKTYGPVPTE